MRGRISSALTAQTFRPIVRAYVSLGKAGKALGDSCPLRAVPASQGKWREPGRCARGNVTFQWPYRWVEPAKPLGPTSAGADHRQEGGVQGQRLNIKDDFDDNSILGN